MVEEPGRSLEGELERFRDAGLYDPASPDATQRAELLEYLLERFSVDEILYWVEHTNLVGVAARAVDRPPPFISAQEAASRAGVTIDVVIDLRTALGFPVIDPTVRSVPETFIDDVKRRSPRRVASLSPLRLRGFSTPHRGRPNRSGRTTFAVFASACTRATQLPSVSPRGNGSAPCACVVRAVRVRPERRA